MISVLRNISLNILAILLLLIVLFLGLELILRVVLRHSMELDIEMWKYASNIKRVSSNHEIGHEHLPNSHDFLMGVDVNINSIGLRNPELSYGKPDGIKRILMLGDSLTFGWGVKEEDTVSRILQRMLNNNAEEWEVINSGVGNYNTSMEVAFFMERGYKLNPDMVILNYFINDAEETPRQNMNFFLRWSYAYVFFKGRLDILQRIIFGKDSWDVYYRKLYEDHQPGWQKAQASIKKLKEYCDKRSIKLMLVNYPELHLPDKYPFYDISNKIKALSEDNNIEFVDLLPSVINLNKESLWVTPADTHPNAVANLHFAAAIYDRITRQGNQSVKN